MKERLGWFVLGGVVAGLALLAVYGLSRNPADVITSSLGEPASVGTGAGTRSIIVNHEGMICAEPSPDIMASLVSNVELAAQGEQEGAAKLGGLIKAMQQSGGEQIFERSQGIQALRDGMYRLCEAHLNKAIPQETYVEQMTDLVATLNFIVPIELCSQLSRDVARMAMIETPQKVTVLRQEERDSGAETATSVAMGDTINTKISSSIQAMTAILVQCIQTSYEFGANIARNSGERGRARLAAETSMGFVRFKIAHALRSKGVSCADMVKVSSGEIDCSILGITDVSDVPVAPQ